MDSIFVDNSVENDISSSGSSMMRISKIEPNPLQPRREFDTESLSELAESIAGNGLIQPVVVRPSSSSGFYTIIAGERRWRASKMAGLSEIPVIIMEADDKKAAELALIENIQRKDLNPIEEARAYRSLIEEYNLTQSEAAAQVGKSRVAVTNALRLLELPDEVLSLVTAGSISTGHARALLGLKNADLIPEVAKAAAEGGISVRALEEKVRKINSMRQTQTPPIPDSEKVQREEYFKALENAATGKVGNKVRIHSGPKSKRVTIEFESNEELEDILKKLCGDSIFDEIK